VRIGPRPARPISTRAAIGRHVVSAGGPGERASGNGGRSGRPWYTINHAKSDRNSMASAGRLSMREICDAALQVRERSGMRSEASTPLESKQSLAPGVRVRMSAFGLARHPKYGGRQGLIVGRGSASSWRVKFDERKSIQTIHQDYLETAERSGAVSSDQSDVQDISSYTTSRTWQNRV
jgi:hypothetical protein